MAGDDPIVLSLSEKEVVILPQVREVLREFSNTLQVIDPAFFEGLYLTGSITHHDFHPSKSDIDFVVLCKALPDKIILEKISNAHKRIEKKLPSPALNGWYITRECLTFDPQSIRPSLLFEKGKLQHLSPGITPVTIHDLKTNGICISGIAINNLSINVAKNDVAKYLYENINSYWANWLNRHSKWSHGKLFLMLFPRFTEWVVLGVARQYYTLKTGMITSKTKAGYFALQHMPQEFQNILNDAIQIRKDHSSNLLTIKNSYSIMPSFQRYNKTIRCARYIIQQFNSEYQTAYSNV